MCRLSIVSQELGDTEKYCMNVCKFQLNEYREEYCPNEGCYVSI
jgi:hypothetical protein